MDTVNEPAMTGWSGRVKAGVNGTRAVIVVELELRLSLQDVRRLSALPTIHAEILWEQVLARVDQLTLVERRLAEIAQSTIDHQGQISPE